MFDEGGAPEPRYKVVLEGFEPAMFAGEYEASIWLGAHQARGRAGCPGHACELLSAPNGKSSAASQRCQQRQGYHFCSDNVAAIPSQRCRCCDSVAAVPSRRPPRVATCGGGGCAAQVWALPCCFWACRGGAESAFAMKQTVPRTRRRGFGFRC